MASAELLLGITAEPVLHNLASGGQEVTPLFAWPARPTGLEGALTFLSASGELFSQPLVSRPLVRSCSSQHRAFGDVNTCVMLATCHTVKRCSSGRSSSSSSKSTSRSTSASTNPKGQTQLQQQQQQQQQLFCQKAAAKRLLMLAAGATTLFACS